MTRDKTFNVFLVNCLCFLFIFVTEFLHSFLPLSRGVSNCIIQAASPYRKQSSTESLSFRQKTKNRATLCSHSPFSCIKLRPHSDCSYIG